MGSLGSFPVTASGFPASTFSETGPLPTGVTLDPSTGILFGTPAVGTGGIYPITITASNGVSPDATQSFTLTVDEAPAITSANSATFTAGILGNFPVTSLGFPDPTFSETGILPTGVTLDPTTGILSGTPAAGTGGTYPITITATNGIGSPATQNFTLTVNEAPAITSADSTGFILNTAGTFTVTARGFPIAALSETGALPPGVTFLDNANDTATLSGTATSTGTYPITITAAVTSNGIVTKASQSFTLTVNEAPAITTTATSTTFTASTPGTPGTFPPSPPPASRRPHSARPAPSPPASPSTPPPASSPALRRPAPVVPTPSPSSSPTG